MPLTNVTKNFTLDITLIVDTPLTMLVNLQNFPSKLLQAISF